MLFVGLVVLEERSFEGDERLYNFAFPKAGRWEELLVATHLELVPRSHYLWLGFLGGMGLISFRHDRTFQVLWRQVNGARRLLVKNCIAHVTKRTCGLLK